MADEEKTECPLDESEWFAELEDATKTGQALYEELAVLLASAATLRKFIKDAGANALLTWDSPVTLGLTARYTTPAPDKPGMEQAVELTLRKVVIPLGLTLQLLHRLLSFQMRCAKTFHDDLTTAATQAGLDAGRVFRKVARTGNGVLH